MNRSLVDRIADAVLYEGYILYPYRPSVKNRQRWTFGGLYPEVYCQVQSGSDSSSNQTECLIQGSPKAVLDVTVRFLQLTERTVGQFAPPLEEWTANPEPAFRMAESLRIGDQDFHPWQEAEEREIRQTSLLLEHILERPQCTPFDFPGRRWLEPLRGLASEVAGVLVRNQQAIEGAIETEALRLADGLFKLAVRVVNCTTMDVTQAVSRERALLRSLVATHTILGVHGGEFVSLLDPPGSWREAAAACRNIGTWPVLVGEYGARDTVLSSPIILYDYPQIAPESPGTLFDGTEIDEILTLRILSLTDEEKRAAATLDHRTREVLARTEALSPEQLVVLHGTIRLLRPLSGENA
jgi:hydrogenase maturation protease